MFRADLAEKLFGGYDVVVKMTREEAEGLVGDIVYADSWVELDDGRPRPAITLSNLIDDLLLEMDGK